MQNKYARKGWWRSLLYAGAGVGFIALTAHAQQRSVPEDFATQMAGSDHTASLGPDVFGDTTDLYTGATQFFVTDVNIPGNSDLPVALQRSLEAADSGLSGSAYGLPSTFMTWTRYEVPYLSGVYPEGWVSSVGTAASNQRCSLTSGPPEIKDGKGSFGTWESNEYWHGNHLYLPGAGSQVMLVASGGNPPTDGPTYPWMTKDNWYFSCLSATANGQAGEAFLARSPDGKKYYFNHLVNWRQVATLRKFDEETDLMVLGRDEYRLLLTRVEDRFGNWVQYAYSGKDLTSITANDGRQLTLTYAAPGGAVTSVSDGTRTWTYDYSSGVRVTFPDATIWQSTVSGPGVSRNNLSHPDGSVSCNNAAYSGETTLTIQQRSGAIGTFLFRPLRRGLSHVFYNPAAAYPCPQLPKHLDNIAIYSKTVSGAGLQTATWSYVYGPANDCFAGSTGQWNSTPCTAASPTTRYVEVYGPGTFVRYTFGNKWQDTDGTLFRTEQGASASSILRDEALTWQTFNVPAFAPMMAGGSILSSIVRTIATRTIAQGGAAYATTNSNWDAYYNPQTVVENGPNGGARTSQYTYHHNRANWVLGQIASRSYPGKSMVRSFNPNATVAAISEDGVSTSFTYHTDGNVATTTYPRSLIHSFSSYKRGIAQSESRPEGVNLSRVVSDAGFVTSETNGEGRTQSYGYDPMGRVTSIDHPRGNDVTIVYSGTTKSTKTTTRGGLVQTVSYDALWRPVSVTRGGIATTLEYDAYGRQTFESNPSDTIGERSEYDALGRISKLTHPDTTYRSFTYGAGNVVVRDERGNFTTRSYRSYGDPAEALLVGITAAEPSANMVIGRATNGLVNSIQQAGRERTFGYDTRNFLTSETNPETGTATYERDDAGNMTARIIGSLRVEYAYDGLNQLSTVTYPDATPDVTQTWSKTGKLRTVTSSAAARVLGYDENDNLTSESLTIGGTTLTAQYTPDDNDQLSSVTYPVSQRVVSYAPDALGRPTRVSGYVSSVSYWPSGLVRQINYANGTTTSYEQNSRLWPSTFATRRGGVYSINSSYLYDGLGNLSSVTDTVDGTMNRSLGYDGIDRLTSASGPWGSGTIAYDGAGNITSQNLGSFNVGYTYDAQNRLASVSGSRAASYAYDQFGNISAAGGASYNYDAVPNLRCANCGSGNRTDYTYDGVRNRVSVSKGGTTTYEFYTAQDELLVEYTPSQSNRLVEYIYLGNQRVAQRVSDTAPPTSLTPISTTLTANSSGGVSLGVLVGGTSPLGSVSFAEQGTALGTAFVTGNQASVEVLGLTAGSHTFAAAYSGDKTNSGNTLTFQATVIIPLPGVPTSISVPGTSTNGSYSVNWGGASGYVTAYELYEATNPSFSGQTLVHSGTATSKSFSGRGDGTYYYRVRACNGGGCSEYRTGGNGTTVTLPPGTPASISVATTNWTGSYTVNWSAASSGTASSYELYEATNPGFSGAVLVYNGAGLAAGVSGRSDGTYYYRVRACNGSGCSGYRVSDAVTVLLPPGVPSSISVPSVSYNGSYTITWGTASGAVGWYQLFEANNPSFSGETLVYNGGGTAAGFSGRGNGVYYYRVRACNVAGCSGSTAGSGVTVSLLQASLSGTYWQWYGVRRGDTTISPNIVVTASGGSGGYTYSWERTSGDGSIRAKAPTANSTGFTGREWDTYGVYFTATFRCRVADTAGNAVYTPDVTVRFRADNDE